MSSSSSSSAEPVIAQLKDLGISDRLDEKFLNQLYSEEFSSSDFLNFDESRLMEVDGDDVIEAGDAEELAAGLRDLVGLIYGFKGSNLLGSLTKSGIKLKPLVAFIFQIISTESSSSSSSSSSSRLAQLASRVYLALLQLEGSSLYNVYNTLVFGQVVRVVKNSVKRATMTKKDQAAEEDAGENDEEMPDHHESAPSDRERASYLPHLVAEFSKFLSATQILADQPEVLMRVADLLTESIEEIRDFEIRKSNVLKDSQVIKASLFEGLSNLLIASGKALSSTLPKVLKGLLHVLLVMKRGAQSQTIPKNFFQVAETASSFLKAITQGPLNANNPEVFEEKLFILLQHICIKVPERADFRGHAAGLLVSILGLLTDSQLAKFAPWLKKFTKNSRTSYRLFGTEILGLVYQSDAFAEKNLKGEATFFNNHKEVFNMLFSRIHDKSPGVRARALTLLTTVIEETTTKSPARFGVVSDFLAEFYGAESSSGISLVTTFQRRAADEKSTVRKAALSLIKACVIFVVKRTDKTDGLEVPSKEMQLLLDSLEERSADPVMTIRKQSLEILTELVITFPQSAFLRNKWQKAVFPAITDRETAIQEYTVSCVNAVLIQHSAESEANVWSLISKLENNDFKYFQRICAGLAQKNHFSLPYVASVQETCKDWNNVGAWILLAEISVHLPNVISEKILLGLWPKAGAASPRVSSCYLRVLAGVASKFSAQDAAKISQEIQGRLQSLETDLGLISVSIEVLKRLAPEKGRSVSGKLEKWCQQTMGSFENKLTSLVMQENKGEVVDEESLCRCLFTIGEIYQIAPSKLAEKLVTCLQGVVASPSLSLNSSSSAASSSPAVTSFSASIRAQGLITLGKISLQDEDFAKKYISALAKEMKESDDAIMRNNAMMILCDLCVRYPSIVDKYVPAIASCLHDPHELVRRQTLTMLTRMLQEDYVKWKGSLFFQFVTSVADDSKEIRVFGEYCLVHLLTTKQPTILFNHFVDAIFYLNNYSMKRTTDKLTSLSPTENTFTSFAGAADAERKRKMIYKFLLSNLSDEHKFQLSFKLCVENLSAVVDGNIDINEPNGAMVLSDILHILSSEEIKLSSQKPKEKEEEESLDEALANAKSKVLSKISKKNNIENMIPVIIELKHTLEDCRSPLLKNLMAFLCSLVKDFRVEMEDLMAGDKQLANEIEFDIRQFEKAKTPAVSKVQPRMVPALERLAQVHSPFKSPKVLSSATKPAAMAAAAGEVPRVQLFKTPSKINKAVAPTPSGMNLSMISPVLAKSVEKSFQVIHMNTPEISPSLMSEAMKQSTPGRSMVRPNIVLPSPSTTKTRGITRMRSWNIYSPAPKESPQDRKRTRDEQEEGKENGESDHGESQESSFDNSLEDILTMSAKKGKLAQAEAPVRMLTPSRTRSGGGK